MFRKRISRKQLLKELDYLLLMIESDWDVIELQEDEINCLKDDLNTALTENEHLRAENKKLIRLLFEVR